MLHVHVDHIASVMVVVVPFQVQSPYKSDISKLDYCDSESESSSDGHLKGPEEPLSKPHLSPRPHPLTTSQSTEESMVDQEGKWAYVFVKNSLIVSVYIYCSYLRQYCCFLIISFVT